MQQSALMDWCDLNTEAKKRIKNKKAGRRSAPHVGENGGLFRYIGAYVAFASFVYHSLVVLVIALQLRVRRKEQRGAGKIRGPARDL